MQEGFAAERSRRQQDFEKRRDDYNNMEKTMTAKMEEGFRNEQQARQQAQKEIMIGLKKEENARQMVQNDLQTIEDKIRQLELGSGTGSTVGSDVSTAVGKGPSGTFARAPPGVAVRLNDLFLPRRMEFKGWVTATSSAGNQGLTDTEVPNFIQDLHRMVPDPQKKMWIGTKEKQNKEHGQQKLRSICGSAMKRMYQRGSGCWTLSEQNSRRSPTSRVKEWSPADLS